MADELRYSPTTPALYRGQHRFAPWQLAWEEVGLVPQDAAPVTPREAVRWLHGAGGARRVPIGVIGPREATAEERATAEALGGGIAELGFELLCGGKSGVMEAVCRGARNGGGRPIGLLPDEEWHSANDFVTVPIATGIGNARNAIIARACFALVAVGGGYGTISEMAFGLHYGRLVLTLGQAPQIPGAVRCDDVDEALERACRRFLLLDGESQVAS